jgi:(p)ppGpp synthase/HD superfamily hydrolase
LEPREERLIERTATRASSVPGIEQRLDAALAFARRAHSGQLRKQNDRPFIEHPIAIAALLADHGLDGPILVAAYLHDVVEKTEVEVAEIEREFGDEVAAIVAALSEDPALEGYAARKRALRSQALAGGRDAAILYAADRLGNLRDWRELSAERRREAAERLGTTLEERLRLWGEDLEALADLDPGMPFVEEVELELRALRAEAG